MRHGGQIGGGGDSGYILAKCEFEGRLVVLVGEAGYKLEHGHHAGFEIRNFDANITLARNRCLDANSGSLECHRQIIPQAGNITYPHTRSPVAAFVVFRFHSEHRDCRTAPDLDNLAWRVEGAQGFFDHPRLVLIGFLVDRGSLDWIKDLFGFRQYPGFYRCACLTRHCTGDG